MRPAGDDWRVCFDLYVNLLRRAERELPRGTRYEIHRLGEGFLMLSYSKDLDMLPGWSNWVFADPRDCGMADGPVIARGITGESLRYLGVRPGEQPTGNPAPAHRRNR